MLDNYYMAITKVADDERKKVTRTSSISKVPSKLTKSSDDKFKDRYERAKRNVSDNEDVIVDDSLNNVLEENKKITEMVRERFVQNPMLKEIFNKDNSDEDALEEMLK